MSKLPSLLVAPQPISDESSASWFYRLCNLHQRSARDILSAMDITRMSDPDIDLTEEHVRILIRGTQIPATSVAPLANTFVHIPRSARRLVLRHEAPDGTGTYAYCPQCLAEDEEPYLRIAWRVTHWDFCSTHRVKMCSQCWKCAGYLRAQRVAGRSHLTSLRFCAECNADLGMAAREDVSESCDVELALATQKAYVAAYLKGYFLMPPVQERLSLDFLIWCHRRSIPLMGVPTSQIGATQYALSQPARARWMAQLYRRFVRHLKKHAKNRKT